MKQTMQKIAIALCMALAFAACKNDDPETGGGVETVTIDKNELSLVVNGSATLQAKINDVVSTAVTWSSNKPSVATVDNNGKVTAVGEGTATITATANADTTKKAMCSVTVEKADITVAIDPTILTLGIGEDATLQAKINGVNSTEVTWKSSDDAVAAVDSNGKVTAKKEGTTTITATANADTMKKATCTVTVEGADVVQPSSIAVSPTSLSLKEGDTNTLAATIDNADKLDADHKKITWTSSDEGVATVNDNGLVTAVSAGTAMITAATTNGEKATCAVTVTAQTTTPVVTSADEWNFVGKADEVPYKDFDGSTAGSITSDIPIPGKNNNLTLVLSAAGTSVGNTISAPKYKYQTNNGLCIKGAAFKIDGIKGSVTATIQWYLGGSTDRDLEVTVGNGETKKATAVAADKGKSFDYTDTFDGGNGTTLYIGASNELYIKSITIKSQSGSGTPPSTPTDPDPTDKTISLTDAPLGYASKGTSYATTGGKTVTNRADLLSAIKSGGVIIINGMIDMSDGKLPAEGTRTDADMTGFDAFVSKNSTYTSYKALRDAYVAECSETTDDKSSSNPQSTVGKTIWALNEKYGTEIKLVLKSDTTLVGKGPNCGIRGGSIQINGQSNIQIRNLIIKDAFDPFPHHEKNDGYNAQWDGINIQGASKNIWIDHCTLMDTCTLGFVKTGGSKDEKWQVYDGLCDIKGNSEYITVSNCKFYQHDKTMLIGNDDAEGLTVTRTITLYRNYFFNCGQRLPMVRNSNIHILNNYYDYDGTWYLKDGQQYAIGVRANANVYSENNYFGDGIKYSVSGATGSAVKGSLYSTGDSDESKSKKRTDQFNTSNTSQFTPDYNLDKLEASAVPESVKSSAGAGYTLK